MRGQRSSKEFEKIARLPGGLLPIRRRRCDQLAFQLILPQAQRCFVGFHLGQLPPAHVAVGVWRGALLDGLARVGALSGADGEYLPLIAPRGIRRIDLYEKTNDCALAASTGIRLYATPREESLLQESGSNRFVAAGMSKFVMLPLVANPAALMEQTRLLIDEIQPAIED